MQNKIKKHEKFKYNEIFLLSFSLKNNESFEYKIRNYPFLRNDLASPVYFCKSLTWLYKFSNKSFENNEWMWNKDNE
jgi:hypothetical protein